MYLWHLSHIQRKNALTFSARFFPEWNFLDDSSSGLLTFHQRKIGYINGFGLFRLTYMSQGLSLVEKWALLLIEVGITLKWDCMCSLVVTIIFFV